MRWANDDFSSLGRARLAPFCQSSPEEATGRLLVESKPQFSLKLKLAALQDKKGVGVSLPRDQCSGGKDHIKSEKSDF